MNTQQTQERGSIHASTVIVIVLTVLLAGAGSFGIWAYLQYQEQKTDVDGKIDLAVATARKEQADADEVKFIEREKEPNRQFVGPSDYGRVTFEYPKTWSVYEARDAATGGSYEAYLNPIVVPQVNAQRQFALRVTIVEQDYDTVLRQYQAIVKRGDLKSTAATIGEYIGTRLDGNFTKDIRGASVIFKIRDKTLIIRTDSNTFIKDFDALVKTIEFNK